MERTHDLGVTAGGAELGAAGGGASGGVTAGLIAFNWFIWAAVLLVPAGCLGGLAWRGLPAALLLYLAAAAGSAPPACRRFPHRNKAGAAATVIGHILMATSG